ncbi:MAG: alpha/beta fold hydrolase [Actinomycetota bacterium]|nr:alpha/beta fold hydrolase [Actinomycetota bacterium]
MTTATPSRPAPEVEARPAPDVPQGALETAAAEAVLGANPFVGLNPRQVVEAAARLLTRLGLRPRIVAKHAAHLAAELARVVVGRSSVAPAKGDKRWSDPAWQENPAYRRVQQIYLAVVQEIDKAIDDAGLDIKSDMRGRFAIGILTEALAPTNTLLNPTALKRAFDTGGGSLVRGAKHLVRDLRTNGGMPSTVDRRPFQVGETVARTPGQVVFRNEVLELMQYQPSTERVREVPLVYLPPQINKFYILDLAPGRSLIEYTVGQGVQFFTVSWRNPTKEHADWDLDTYAGAVLEALDVVEEITGSPKANLLGMCAGGMTAAAMLGHLEAIGRIDRIGCVTLLVNMLDTSAPSQIGALASRRSIQAAINKARKQGVHSGRDMSRLFAWLRPNDLVWNYAVNDWLLGKEPPAFDVLAWNADSTDLPAGLYAQYLEMYEGNLLREPGGMSILGTPIDLSKIDLDTYCMAGSTDHIVTWRAAYQTTQVLGGKVEFVLSNAGHIQAMVNPVGGKKASYRVGLETGPDPDAWLAASQEHRGSWWEHWIAWLTERSGDERPAPQHLGSAAHPPLEPAPGSYVRASSR